MTEGFATSNNDQRAAVYRGSGSDAVQYPRDAFVLPAPRIIRIAPRALKVTSGEPDENRWVSTEWPLALNGVEDAVEVEDHAAVIFDGFFDWLLV